MSDRIKAEFLSAENRLDERSLSLSRCEQAPFCIFKQQRIGAEHHGLIISGIERVFIERTLDLSASQGLVS